MLERRSQSINMVPKNVWGALLGREGAMEGAMEPSLIKVRPCKSQLEWLTELERCSMIVISYLE
jgi:hypothetical protein